MGILPRVEKSVFAVGNIKWTIMKPNYKNWIPKGMILGALGGAAASLVLFLVFGLSGLLAAGTWKIILKIVFLILAIVLTLVALWMWLLHRTFSYDGARNMPPTIRRFAKKTQRPKGWTTALLSPKAMR